MARDYILRESATQRKALIDIVVASLIEVGDCTGSGATLSLGISLKNDDYRSQLIEKLTQGVPISDIPEFERWMKEEQPKREEMERKRREWREVALYRTAIEKLAEEVLDQTLEPTEFQCQQLVESVKRNPLLKEEPSATLNDIRAICSRHPWLNLTISMLVGHLRFIESATNEQRSYFINRMWKAWSKQEPQKEIEERSMNDFQFADFDALISSISKPEPFNYDDPPIVFFENMQFLFSGKFKFGTRKECGEAVTKKGGFVSGNPNRWVDYLVVASGEENTSPSSSSCSPVITWRARGWPCFVISEGLWTSFLKS